MVSRFTKRDRKIDSANRQMYFCAWFFLVIDSEPTSATWTFTHHRLTGTKRSSRCQPIMQRLFMLHGITNLSRAIQLRRAGRGGYDSNIEDSWFLAIFLRWHAIDFGVILGKLPPPLSHVLFSEVHVVSIEASCVHEHCLSRTCNQENEREICETSLASTLIFNTYWNIRFGLYSPDKINTLSTNSRLIGFLSPTLTDW